MAVLTIVPLMLLPQSAPFGLYTVLVVTTCMFVGMNGRNIPGMALVTSAANPKLRGTFMALNSSVQSAAMGVAAFLGGHIISRDAQGVVLVSRLKLHGAAPPAAVLPASPVAPATIV